MSQRVLARRAVVDHLGRYEDHFEALVAIAFSDKEQDLIPPKLSRATERIKDTSDVEELGKILQEGLVSASLVELGLAALSNLCLEPAMRRLMAAQSEAVVETCCKIIKPNDFKVSEKLAALICNLLANDDRGKVFAEMLAGGDGLRVLLDALTQDKEGILGHRDRVARLLGILLNLCAITPVARAALADLGAADSLLPFLGCDLETEIRTMTILQRMIADRPAILEGAVRSRVAQDVRSILMRDDHLSDVVQGSKDGKARLFELAIRMAVTLVTKAGFLDDLAGESRIVELDELDIDVDAHEWISRLVLVVNKLKRRQYAKDEASPRAMAIGNLALLFGYLVQQQTEDEAKWRLFDFGAIAASMVEAMRKEMGRVQQNCGQCVVKLATSMRYRDLIRDLNGFESLQQIMVKDKYNEDQKAVHRNIRQRQARQQLKGS
mmetsp:Transcript_43058/g.97008  ORF Transcript_43058/g.97008 Transcript_43058/m.97008 type:complete len:438 (+) Transcript_43058:1808-3121(+)